MKYYELAPRIGGGRGPGWEMINYDRLQPDNYGMRSKVAWPDGYMVLPRGPWTMPSFVENPHFIINDRAGHLPRDIEVIDGFLFLSANFKSIFETLAPDACEFRPCKTEFKSGTPGPETWLCSVTQAFKDAVDIHKSVIRVSAYGFYMSMLRQKQNYQFKPEVLGNAHVFRLAENFTAVFCDEQFKAACKDANIKGASFTHIGQT